MEKVRLDKFLAEKGLVSSRKRGQDLILAGQVFIDGQAVLRVDKKVCEENKIEIKDDFKWVSRGGLKLEKALLDFGINVQGKVCLDVGASTGGFTDVLLGFGAGRVYAVDAGHGQLVAKLREDKRVVNLEKVNAREIDPKILPEKIEFCCIDVSFISLSLILPEVKNYLAERGEVVALIKPQFEVGKENIEKGGIVKSAAGHKLAVEKVRGVARENGFLEKGIIESPIKGGDGNKEFLIYLTTGEK